MSELTRRGLMAGAAAASAALALPQEAFAGAAAAGKQVPSFYRSRLGDFEVTVVSDGARPIPLPPRFVLNVPNEEVLKAAEAAYMPKGTVFAPFNPLLVNTGTKLVLIDTGYGPIAPTVGLLPQSLAAAGVDPKSIDIVVISHMHGDHINGLKNPDGSLAFPNAEIKVQARDWEFWMDDANMAKAPEGFVKASFGFARKIFGDIKTRVTIYQWGSEVAPGITAVDTAGHTPGHSSFAIQSGQSKLLFQGDVANVPDLFLTNPEWKVMFDNEPDQAVATRKRFYDMAAAEKVLISGYHFPFPGLGWVEKAGRGYRLVPAPWSPVL
ncbi:MAG: MBL fold metallo-hydrolase [Xanthobacteraceae bacterium]|nr:MBL fold metallo-hydrolase [Xanthobacteraceae bacterium]